jgi:hypothetical protein
VLHGECGFGDGAEDAHGGFPVPVDDRGGGDDRGRQEWALVENIPQPGQQRAASSMVTRVGIGLSRSCSSTRVTATPPSPGNRVVSLSKPVALAWMFESQ